MMVYTAMVDVVPQKNIPFCAFMLAMALAGTTLQLTKPLAPTYHGWRWKHPVIERQERQFRRCERQRIDNLVSIPVFEGGDVCSERIVPRCV